MDGKDRGDEEGINREADGKLRIIIFFFSFLLVDRKANQNY